MSPSGFRPIGCTRGPALRLCRHHRRAERRQVDPGQRAGRRQGLDRHPQGADDPRDRARHRHRGRRPDRFRRHAGHLLRRAAGSTAPWSRPPGAARDDADRGRPADRRARGLDDETTAIAATARRGRDAEDPRRSTRSIWSPSRACSGSSRPRIERAKFAAHLHDLGADRRRRRRRQDLARRPCARKVPGSIRRTRSPMRRCARWQRKSRAKRSTCACTRSCRTPRRSKPSSWKERKDGSVRIEQTIYVERESQRKIVLGKGGQTIKSIGEQARKEIAEIAGDSRCTSSCS